MIDREFQPVTFSFSHEAVAMLNSISADVERRYKEPVACFVVRYGDVLLKSGERSRSVVIGLWRRSDLPSGIAPLIQIIDNIPIHFWVRPEDQSEFLGAVIDWTEPEGVFLRRPTDGVATAS